jgi:hypothetical protein
MAPAICRLSSDAAGASPSIGDDDDGDDDGTRSAAGDRIDARFIRSIPTKKGGQIRIRPDKIRPDSDQIQIQIPIQIPEIRSDSDQISI